MTEAHHGWRAFFPAATPVARVPVWGPPRLYLRGDTFRSRWHGSRLFTATRWPARVLRTVHRLQTTLWPRLAESDDLLWSAASLIRATWPDGCAGALWIGTPGPAQKWTLEVWNRQSRPIGYLKFGLSPTATTRLQREHAILRSVPGTAGPEVLAFSPLGPGKALLLGALDGRPPPARRGLPAVLTRFLRTLHTDRACSIDEHPFARALLSGPEWDDVREALRGRSWPIVIQHGDLVPWNMRAEKDTVRAFDWEYGRLDGLPYVDAIYYLLQVDALIHRVSPRQGALKAHKALSRLAPELSGPQRVAFLRIAAWSAFQDGREDGLSDELPLQRWRQAIWRPADPCL